MDSVTLTIAIATCFVVLCLRPVRALAVYLTVIMWYPMYLVITIGTIDMTLSRIVVTVLLLKCLANADLRNKFKWCPLDTWVIIYMLICVIIPFISSVTHTSQQLLENRGGFLTDSLFVYIVARLCLKDRPAMIALIKWVTVALVPLALLGIIETTTGWQPFIHLRVFAHWGIYSPLDSRFGFYRAVGPFPQPILFGSFFVMLLPLVYYLRNVPNYPRILAYLLSGIVIAGALSSMSSGPLSIMMVAILCIIMERFKGWIKPALIGFIICCLFVELASNRHLYHVFFALFNPLGGHGYHRARLIDSAIKNFDEWWLVGYRGLDPGWLPISAITFTDVTNMYLVNGVSYGILGIIAFCGMLICSMREMFRLHNSSNDPKIKSWAWALGSTVLILIVACLGSNIRGQVQFLFYVILGMVGSSSNLRVKVGKNIRNTWLSLNVRDHFLLKHQVLCQTDKGKISIRQIIN